MSDIGERYVALSRLSDLETTIGDAAPEELPALHAKLLALSGGIHETVLTLIDEARADELIKLDATTDANGVPLITGSVYTIIQERIAQLTKSETSK